MGKVYQATQLQLGRPVAVKVLDTRGAAADEASFERRFLREAEVCAGLTHPNTVRVFDSGRTDDGRPYLVMELLTGITLADVMQQGPVDPLQLINILKQACGSLAEAHALGLVHRDLKPSNLFLVDGEEARVKVVDFGLVKELGSDAETTRAGVLLGSPLYMSPEQITEGVIDSRSDVYSLGIVLFIALTGTSPFAASLVSAILVAHVHAAVPSLQDASPHLALPECLNWVVQRCLTKRPEARIGSVRELARALAACEAVIRGDRPSVFMGLDAGRVVLPDDLDVSLMSTRPVYIAGGAWIHRPRRAILVALPILALALSLFAVMLSLPSLSDAPTSIPTSSPIVEPLPALQSEPAAVEVALHLVIITTDPPTADIVRDGQFVGNGRVVIGSVPGTSVIVSAVRHRPRQITLDGLLSEVHVVLEKIPLPASSSVSTRPSVATTPSAEPEPETAISTEPSATEPESESWRSPSEVRDPWDRRP
ncbi:MAG: serine/threonine-protein kinase [Myxococcota bacterium]|jgi:serine/threonine-protein kinase